jgi:hypothetical protein
MADETTPTEPAKLEVPAPGSKRKTPDEVVPDGDVCGDCWPSGWPDDTAAASCLHGSWTR